MSENAGYATLQIIPSMKGFGEKLRKQADRETDKAGESSGKRFSSGFMGGILGGAVVGGLTVLGGKIRDFGAGAVGVFSEVEDATGAAGVVFGKAVSDITKFASSADSKFGLAQGAALNAALTFGTLGKAAGKQGPALSGFATQMAGLAGDLASFRGTSTEQAVEAIGAALRGEMEPIRAYGVLLDDATLKQQAMKMGLIKTTKDALTPANKTLAAQAAILAQTKDAQGDFVRTSDSTANTQKRLQAATENAQAVLGKKLAPAMTAVRRIGLGLITGLSGVIGIVEGVGKSFSGVWAILKDGDFLGSAATFGFDEDSPAVGALFEIRDAAISLFGYITGTAIPVAKEFASTVVFPALKELGAFIVSTLIPGLIDVSKFLVDNKTAVLAVGAVIAAILLPHFIALGVQATVAKVKMVAAWVATRVNAVKSAVVHSGAVIKTVAGWVLMGVQSLAAAARMAAAWFIALGPIGWVTAAVIAIVALVIANWDTVKAWTLKAWSAVSGAVVAAWQSITATLSGIASTVGGWLATLGAIIVRVVDVITFPIRLALAIAVTLMIAGWNLIKAPVLAAVSFIGGLIRSYFNLYLSIIRVALNAVMAVVGKVWGGIKAAFSAGFSVVKAVVGTGVGWIMAGVNRLSTLASIVGGFFGRIVSAVNGKISQLVSAAKGIAGKVLGAIGDLGSLLYDKGAAIVSGLIEGIRGMGGRLAGFVKQFIKDHIPAPVAKALRINSPSKVMADQAKWIPLGIVKGIESKAGVLDRTMANLVRDPRLPSLDKTAIASERAGIPPRPVQVDVHPSPGMDEYELATKTVRAIDMAGV